MTAMVVRLRKLQVITTLTLFGIVLTGYLFANSFRYPNSLSSGFDTMKLALHQGLLQPPTKHEPSDVLILTYMRSGSTFVGKILGWRDDTFYWYEPMWGTHKWSYLSGDHLMCNYKKPGCKPISKDRILSVNKTLRFLLDVYRCDNLTNHWKRYGSIQRSPNFAGPTGHAFVTCMNMSYSPGKGNKVQSSRGCFKRVSNSCVNKTHKVIKALRLETTLARYLLEQHKRLKLVQIFRDPRAVIYSRTRCGWYYGKVEMTDVDSQVLCKRMLNDIEDIEKLKTLYPERVKILQYEDFYDPHRLAINLYSFLNMKMSESAESLLRKLTLNNKKSGFHPDSYRSGLDWKIIKSTTKHCRSVLERLGLRIFEKEEELRNVSLNVILGNLPFKID